MDYLISGVDTLLINVNGILKILKLSDILKSEDINLEQFREVAVLCGNRSEESLCDDIDTSIKYIRHYGSIYIMKMNYDKYFKNLNYETVIEFKKRYYPTRDINTYLNIDDVFDKQ